MISSPQLQQPTTPELPTPTPSATTTTVGAPIPTPNPADMLNTANLAIQISVAIVALVTLLIALTALLGLREVTAIRKRSAELKDEIDQSTKARKELEARLASFEADLDSLVLVAHLFNEGETAYAATDYDRAIHFYNEALQIQPGNDKIKVRLARCFVNKGMNSRAERLLREATASDPTNSDAWRALSTSRRYVDLGEAVRFAERALECDGSSEENWNYLGLLLRDEGRFDEAVAAHEEAARVSPLSPFAYFYKGLLFARLRQTDEAMYFFRDSYAKVDMLRKTNRIKAIWADTIEWGFRRHLDTPEDETRASEIANSLAQTVAEKRNRQAILSHMVFYIRAIGAEPESDLSLSWFRKSELEHAMLRAHINERE